jgi:hypothetical protein
MTMRIGARTAADTKGKHRENATAGLAVWNRYYTAVQTDTMAAALTGSAAAINVLTVASAKQEEINV